ncbi:hypothetical protein F5890DRAFT_1556356 [Lentinula detonsa]|uniref:Uncharacterized protein n=1 Tax=Lentinula detonsa TaxID=2804962 RepID=A0AA38PV95_9AGAR|nr:hypothetical protein F5890DRAFT_1556356 [Lentinula detonsa]
MSSTDVRNSRSTAGRHHINKHRTTGNMTVYEAVDFPVTSATATVASNGDVTVTLTASRTIHIESDVCSGDDCAMIVFDQSLDYSNIQTYLDGFNIQNVLQMASGTVTSIHNGVAALKDGYSYPFAVNITSLNNDGSMCESPSTQVYDYSSQSHRDIRGSVEAERQIAGGFFEESSAGNTGNGTSNNTFSYVDTVGNTFSRTVRAALNNITFDAISGSLANTQETLVSQGSQRAKFARVRMPVGRTVGV